MHYITQILNWISLSLLLPVTILLIAALAASLVTLGGFGSTCLGLLRQRRGREYALKELEMDHSIDFTRIGSGVFARHLHELAELDWDEIHCEKRISDWHRSYERELERAGFMVKVGPMLGLMGDAHSDGTGTGRTRFRRHRFDGLQHADRLRHHRGRLFRRRRRTPGLLGQTPLVRRRDLLAALCARRSAPAEGEAA
ncbi:MAG: hypothetical protein L6W00_04365 [Lentisphaeria bacterium]|nr:MAG: hypothetical protein L6W00_04365 [Lentisphaeria bacterium]